MLPIPVRNPFPGAACWLVPETDSTMDEARRLTEAGRPEGTVIAADRQTAGRGRFRDRAWVSEPGRDLAFTVILPAASCGLPGLPLRAGLALHRAVAELARAAGTVPAPDLAVKWPNDLLVRGRKAAGILCESSGGRCRLGVGVNCGRPSGEGFRTEATGLAEEFGEPVGRFLVLELFLARLAETLAEEGWREEVSRRLWLLDRPARFRTGLSDAGAPGSRTLEGIVRGVGPAGELLLETAEGLLALASGELSRA
jgi:BirA family biotin operon repressor/biotin-[acetyl-CoA-carboxylase] ligase